MLRFTSCSSPRLSNQLKNLYPARTSIDLHTWNRYVSLNLKSYSRTFSIKCPSGALQVNQRTSSNLIGRSTHKSLYENPIRSLSSSTNSQKNAEKGDGKEATSDELVLTPGEKVVVGTRLSVYAGVLAFAGVCAYFIGKELLPTKMSPNTVFDKAFNKILKHSEVKRRFGEPLKAYGRDHGGHREGRRNFIEHTEYTDKDDGSNRTRVRFNLEGKFGTAFVFAEVSSEMPSGEFVYILVQDKRNGQVINVVDNRSALLAKRMAGGSDEGRRALQNLLGGSGSK